MKSYSLRWWYCGAIAGAACSFAVLASAADEVVTGNLTVDGDVDIGGGVLSLGTRSDSSNAPGLNLLYSDATAPSIYFSATRNNASWLWQRDDAKMQMKLGGDNKLQLFDQEVVPVARITLDPVGDSILSNSIIVNGADNRMPNQAITGGSSILTKALADGRYLVNTGSGGSGVNAASVSGGYAYGDYSTGISGGGVDFSTYSAAIGDGYVIFSSNTVALSGGGAFSANYSTAMSGGGVESSYATGMSGGYTFGDYSTAMGGGVTYGIYSTTMGFSEAEGDYSVAAGYRTYAQGLGQIVIGANNIKQGNPSVWVSTDDLFIVGNGIGDGTIIVPSSIYSSNPHVRSNAFVIKKNGNMWVKGDSILVGGLDVAGNTKVSGVITTTKLRVPPSGDLSMGSFTAGTNPAP
jgi:hypothetical protein